jgi:hypothetical protein|tara:strand:- start:310 stop:534 length:225 start_codon:yes stop_codon:yes gene_type:complete
MSNDKVITMPGVLNTSARVITSNELKAESNLLDDLQALLEKYNGKVTNLSMVGALTIYANQVMLGSLLGEDDEL